MRFERIAYDMVLAGLAVLLVGGCRRPALPVTTRSLMDEMADLTRLTRMPDVAYRTVQFSSYDRRSTSPTDRLWFANEDGFGGEPIPGFQKVLKEPGEEGIGEYLICDIAQPGAILRLWTAGINGNIRLFLDDMTVPVYEGDAQNFFWNTAEALSQGNPDEHLPFNLRQFDAVYFPIPFSKGCRIEWVGDISGLHFYHVGFRIYEAGTTVETFDPGDMVAHLQKLEEILARLNGPGKWSSPAFPVTWQPEITLLPGSTTRFFELKGPKAIEYLSIKIQADNMEAALRGTILSISFDQASVPQVQAPVGDFFGAAPGINPFISYPFSVEPDCTMVCRFLMPFRKEMHMEIENASGGEIKLVAGVWTTACRWEKGKSMHFRARWRINQPITASNINETNNQVSDIPYLDASGGGRLVGTAAYLYNPSSVPTSWGNWWGEGDEKIWVDRDTFPSFFGTGSEDYFNYSWSSPTIFSYAYCGQPRNDGPGNRGYVSNFRWHILDDIPFFERFQFNMELGHHGTVPNFSYGRITYFYALPATVDHFQEIRPADLEEIAYLPWSPSGVLGSAGFRFIQAEQLVEENCCTKVEKEKIAAEGKLLLWSPADSGAQLVFRISTDPGGAPSRIGFTLAHGPDSGTISCLLNGVPVKIGGKEHLDLQQPGRLVLDNHLLETLPLNRDENLLKLVYQGGKAGEKIGIDFIWIK